MGAKITPTTKNKGNTLLGVKIGLRRVSKTRHEYYATRWNEKLTARLSGAVAEKQYLDVA